MRRRPGPSSPAAAFTVSQWSSPRPGGQEGEELQGDEKAPETWRPIVVTGRDGSAKIYKNLESDEIFSSIRFVVLENVPSDTKFLYILEHRERVKSEYLFSLQSYPSNLIKRIPTKAIRIYESASEYYYRISGVTCKSSSTHSPETEKDLARIEPSNPLLALFCVLQLLETSRTQVSPSRRRRRLQLLASRIGPGNSPAVCWSFWC
jgi:hypothetical protein